MASPPRDPPADAQENPGKKSEDYDERLDFSSAKFDPLLALYTPGIKLPVPHVKPLDNINIFKSWLVKNTESNAQPGTSASSTGDGATSKTREENFKTRRFLPHQMPIKVENPKIYKNVLTLMENAGNNAGYLGTLHKCVKENIKVKVIIRNASNVRGYCEGYITAFDKYWNITLKDVLEVWKRKARGKLPGLTGEIIKPTPELLKLFPKVTRLKSNSKTITCQRNVHELMIRGEQIVLINILENQKN